MTNPVIDSVRRALGRTPDSAIAPRPAIYPPRTPGSPDREIDLFLEQVKALAGVGLRLSAAEVADQLGALVEEQSIRRAVVWPTPRLEKLGIGDRLRALGVELAAPNADKHALSQCDLGVTEADFVLPETGTIALLSSREKPRAVSLVARVHLAIISPEVFRPDMHQVFAAAKNDPYMVFITGPSRTSDIELTLTLGVHGPRSLYAWVVA